MYYTALPFEFHPSDYKKYLNSIYEPGVHDESSESRFLKEILDYVALGWSYEKDSWFFNTMSYLLLLGCRISELTSITRINNIDELVLKIYCAKQDTFRFISINTPINQLLLNDFFNRGYVVCNPKEFNRRFKKYYSELWKLAKIKQINEGSHLCRHLHCCASVFGCGVKRETITKAFMWVNDKMIDDYLKLCAPLK
jgi:hypothetical protein